MKCRITFRKRRVFLRGYEKRFSAQGNAEYGVSTSFPLKYPRSWRTRRERATYIHTDARQDACSLQLQQQQLVKCEIVMDRHVLSPICSSDQTYLTQIEYTSRDTPTLFVVAFLSTPLPTASILPTRHLSIPRQRPHEILRVDDAIPRLAPQNPPYITCHATPCHATFTSHHCRASDFQDYIVRIFLHKMHAGLIPATRFTCNAFSHVRFGR